MSHLVDIYLQPGKVFTDLKDRPTFWVPLLLLIVVSVVMILLYYSKVDGAWLVDQMVAASGDDMSAAEVEQMRSVMPGASTMGYLGAAGVVVMTAVMAAVYGLYFMLAAKVTGEAVSFRHGVSLFAWGSMPTLLGSVIVIVGILMMTPQTSMESLMLTNVDPLLVQLPLDHDYSRLAKSFSLLTFWVVGLMALGWKTWTRAGWLGSIVVAALPAVVIYGLMALFA